MRYLMVWVLSALTLSLAVPVLAVQNDRPNPGRYWDISYNSALSMHQAAVPTSVYPVGTVMQIRYKGRQVRVHSIYGGCQCFDISDEAMDRLTGGTGQGVIRAYVVRERGRDG